jgi:hypothetical protein
LSYHNTVEFAEAITCSYWRWGGRGEENDILSMQDVSGTGTFVFEDPVLFEIAYTLG